MQHILFAIGTGQAPRDSLLHCLIKLCDLDSPTGLTDEESCILYGLLLLRVTRPRITLPLDDKVVAYTQHFMSPNDDVSVALIDICKIRRAKLFT